VWTQFDDSREWVVYNHASADIHLLTATARELWALASDGQLHSIEELASALALHHGGAAPGEVLDATRGTLTFMDEAGLLLPLTV
jgi:PqqD family protein of HPr-rel-A system